MADAVISTGDIANRMEGTDERLIPSASECWALFEQQYINGVSLKNRAGKAAEVLAIPGNHDVTNAVGFYRAMAPAKDNGSLLAMYNRANNASLTSEAFDAKRDKVFLSREYGGVRLLFVQMCLTARPGHGSARNWPASLPASRCCCSPTISRTLRRSTSSTPTVPGTSTRRTSSRIWFPTCPASQGQGSPGQGTPELAAFLKKHPAIVAYFHGNENYNEFYTWGGPDNDIAMPVFRVDSPMKGNVSGKDEKRLSFQVVSIDTDAGR